MNNFTIRDGVETILINYLSWIESEPLKDSLARDLVLDAVVEDPDGVFIYARPEVWLDFCAVSFASSELEDGLDPRCSFGADAVHFSGSFGGSALGSVVAKSAGYEAVGPYLCLMAYPGGAWGLNVLCGKTLRCIKAHFLRQRSTSDGLPVWPSWNLTTS